MVGVTLSIESDRSLRPFQESQDDFAQGGRVDLPSYEFLPAPGLIRHWSTEDHEAPSRVRIHIPLLFVVNGSGRHAHAGHLVVATEVALDEVALLECVLDWIAVIATRHLDYLVEANMAGLASLLLMDPIDNCDELAVAAPPTFLLAFYSLIAVFSLICGLPLCLQKIAWTASSPEA